MGPLKTALTVGDGQQCAVRCVHVARGHIVPLSRPVNGGVVLNVKLLQRDGQHLTGQNARRQKSAHVHLNRYFLTFIHYFPGKQVEMTERLQRRASPFT